MNQPKRDIRTIKLPDCIRIDDEQEWNEMVRVAGHPLSRSYPNFIKPPFAYFPETNSACQLLYMRSDGKVYPASDFYGRHPDPEPVQTCERSNRPLFGSVSVSPDWATSFSEYLKHSAYLTKLANGGWRIAALNGLPPAHIQLVNGTAANLAEKPADTVTITPDQFKEIWNVFPVNLQHSILDKMDGHIYRESYVMDQRIINHLYSMAPFGVRDILDKHLKVPSFDVSQMRSGEAMLIEDKSCMFNGEIMVKVGDTFLCINKDGNATRYDPGTLITGRKIPAGTTIAFKTA